MQSKLNPYLFTFSVGSYHTRPADNLPTDTPWPMAP